MSDTLIIGGKTYSGVAGFKATDSGDNELTFVRPTGTKQISITQNGTVTEDVTNYASAEISVNVQGGGGFSADDIATGITGNIVLNEVTVIRKFAFNGQPITGVSGEDVLTINESAFDWCDNLETVSFPKLTTVISNYAFRCVNALRVAHFPLLTSATGNGLFYQVNFSSNNKILTVVLPSIESLGSTAFRQGKFVAVDLGPKLSRLNSDTFYAGAYDAVILRNSSSVVSAATADTIGGLRDVWVPQALIAGYEAATNWSTRISGGYITLHAIEGSQYENIYADGTPIT